MRRMSTASLAHDAKASAAAERAVTAHDTATESLSLASPRTSAASEPS